MIGVSVGEYPPRTCANIGLQVWTIRSTVAADRYLTDNILASTISSMGFKTGTFSDVMVLGSRSTPLSSFRL